MTDYRQPMSLVPAPGQAGGMPLLPTSFEDSPVAAFVIDAAHLVTHWNKACERLTGVPAVDMIRTNGHWKPFYPQRQMVLADLVVVDAVGQVMESGIYSRLRPVSMTPGAYELEDFFPHIGEGGRWMSFTAAPLRDAGGRLVGAIQTLQDVTEAHLAEEALHRAQIEAARLQADRAMLLGQRSVDSRLLRTGNPQPAQSSHERESTTPALSEFFDGSPVPTFVIDADHVVTHWNKACERTIGVAAVDIVGTRNQWLPFYPQERPVLADLIVSGAVEEMVDVYYHGKFRRSQWIPGAYEAEDFFPQMGESGRWLFFSAAPLRDVNGGIVGAIETLQDVTMRKLAENSLHQVQVELEQLVARRTDQLARANNRLEEDIRRREAIEAELLRRNAELTELNEKLSMAQEQLLQSEKLASIGQLAAGVAHEINNPIGYIYSNFGALEKYLTGLMTLLAVYEDVERGASDHALLARLRDIREKIEFDYLKTDLPYLMEESREGLIRVRKIVQDLRDFSRVDADQQWQWADLHQGINSTLNIVYNEIKYKADVVREYGALPEIECLPSQINQVVMNLLVNAAHAIGPERGVITIRSGTAEDRVWIEVEDNGSGIGKENLPRIFDPFFTTKPIGKGTGLGLSLSYGIVQKHGGRIEVDSELGRGSRFRVVLPIQHTVSSSRKEGLHA